MKFYHMTIACFQCNIVYTNICILHKLKYHSRRDMQETSCGKHIQQQVSVLKSHVIKRIEHSLSF